MDGSQQEFVRCQGAQLRARLPPAATGQQPLHRHEMAGVLRLPSDLASSSSGGSCTARTFVHAVVTDWSLLLVPLAAVKPVLELQLPMIEGLVRVLQCPEQPPHGRSAAEQLFINDAPPPPHGSAQRQST